MDISNLELKPAHGLFPVAEIRAHIEALDYVASDPITKRLYLMNPPGPGLRVSLELRDTTGKFYGGTVVKVEADSVQLLQVTLENEAYCRDFAQWMLDRFDCIVFGDHGYEITDRVNRDAKILFPELK